MVGVLTEANDHAVCELSLVGKDKQSKGDKQQADDQRLLESSLTQLPASPLLNQPDDGGLTLLTMSESEHEILWKYVSFACP